MQKRDKRQSAAGFPYVAPSLQEWLETDGLGGFASSTTAGINTRRYHGWLFLSGRDPGDRFLALSKLHDSARTPQGEFDLSTSYYPGGRHPQGVTNLWFFKKDPFPSFTFHLAGRFLTREIFMERGSAGVFCRYLPENRPDGTVLALTARPMCNHRFYHHTARAGSWNPRVHSAGSAVVIEGHPACGDLLLLFHNASFQADPRWYYNMIYPRESRRGLDDTEDHFSPGAFTVEVSPGAPGYFWAGPLPDGAAVEDLARELPQRYEEARFRESQRRSGLAKQEDAGAARLFSLPGRLALAGDQFVVRAGEGVSLVAGYHWFGEWGRDSFIALPGLLLSTRRFEDARQVFRRFCDAIRDGVVPNRFEEGQGAAYNSVDASLWMIRALARYEAYSKDAAFPLMLLPRVLKIIRSYLTGTIYGIAAESGGLLRAGGPDTQVTWMDATVGGIPVTPRHGFAVEVNALWISALAAAARWCSLAGLPEGHRYAALSRQALAEFRRAFTWSGVGLYDRVGDDGPVRVVRPNQVIAAGLPEVDLPLETLRDVWLTAVSRLLTPRGLRTLDPADPDYRGAYKGSPAERDSAYHQGTAWPWLVGPLFDLASKLDRAAGYPAGHGPYCGLVVNRALPGVVYLDRNPCMGTIFEVASGDWPYEPGGTVAQAWSVGEAARLVNIAVRGNHVEPENPDAGLGVPAAPRGRARTARLSPWPGAREDGRGGDGSHPVA